MIKNVLILFLCVFMFSCSKKTIIYYPTTGLISHKGKIRKDGTKVGKWTSYYTYPTPFAIEYRNHKGERKKVKWYFSNGKDVRTLEKYKNDLRNGKQVVYYNTGRDSLVFYCRNDTNIIGTFKVYSKDGKLIKEY